MDQVFLSYTFLESEISMKLLLTFLTITLFSFGASAEYNKKFSAEKCKVLYAMSDTLNTTFMS